MHLCQIVSLCAISRPWVLFWTSCCEAERETIFQPLPDIVQLKSAKSSAIGCQESGDSEGLQCNKKKIKLKKSAATDISLGLSRNAALTARSLGIWFQEYWISSGFSLHSFLLVHYFHLPILSFLLVHLLDVVYLGCGCDVAHRGRVVSLYG